MSSRVEIAIKRITCLYQLLIKLRYYIARYLIAKKYLSCYLYNKCNCVVVASERNRHTFFGYYNISPFNSKGDILFCETSTQKVRGSLEEELEIKIFKSDINRAIKITTTKSWNWQQGCMLQWYAGTDNKIIFNDYSNEKIKYVSIIQNVETGQKLEIDASIYSVAKSGKFALTLNFERLALMRPDYGYFNRDIIWEDMPDDSEDGIWYVDIEKNDKKLIISLDMLKKYKPSETMEGAKHKVNHIDIAPNGERFMFLHRWIGPQGRFMRLLTANSKDGSNLYYVTGDEMVSHNCWWGDKDIISFCRMPDGKNRYVHFKDKMGYVEPIGVNDFSCDGHPSVSPDGKWMLTDDYPDKARFSRVYLYNLKKRKKYIVGAFYQPLKYQGEKRIDLHPKWSKDGGYISIDSGHNGKRSFYIIDVNNVMGSR